MPPPCGSTCLKGKVGDSDWPVNSVSIAAKTQRITANLVSQKLVMQDLPGFIGAKPGAQPAGVLRRGGKILPTEPFSPETAGRRRRRAVSRREIITEKCRWKT
jgi:hypothetical protein